jgi:hypothetical protein
LRALQLQPQLGSSWRRWQWVQLLQHSLPVVRWVAVQGLRGLLGSTDVQQQQLMDQHLSEAEQLAAQMRWVDTCPAATFDDHSCC